MWIAPGFRGGGLGLALLRHVEELLAAEGIDHLSLHARLSAAGFYRKAGYHEVGEGFTEVGIPHLRMEKEAVRLIMPNHGAD